MKKIGILTFHESNNYGAVLQAFALRKTTENLANLPVEIINYKPNFLPKPKPNFPMFKIDTKYCRELAKYFWQYFLFFLPISQRKIEKFSE